MRKGILLLSGAGIAAAVAIALTTTKTKNGRLINAEEGEHAGDEHISENDRLTAQVQLTMAQDVTLGYAQDARATFKRNTVAVLNHQLGVSSN